MTNKPSEQTSAFMNKNLMPTDAGLIDEPEALRRVPVSRRTWFAWRQQGLIPFIRPPGSKRNLYHWPSVLDALLKLQRGGGQ